MKRQSKSWLLKMIRAIVTGGYSIEGKHQWKLSTFKESQKRILVCTSVSTGEQVYTTEITDTSIPDVKMVLDHVITAYRTNGQFYAQTQLISDKKAKVEMTVTTCL